MTLLEPIHKEIIGLFAQAGVLITAEQLQQPPSPEMGDIAFPCFMLAKEMQLAPPAVAQEISEKIDTSNAQFVHSVVAVGPYINITLNTKVLAQHVLQYAQEKGNTFGSSKVEDHNIQFEYSQPNTHKAFHIGHLRNAVLGYALVQMWRSQGNAVQPVTYVNDVGSHVAKCLWALEHFYKEEDIPETERGRFLGNVYARATAELDAAPERKEEVQNILQLLESGDEEMVKKWKETRQWSLDGFDDIYKDLGIAFDKAYYESDVKEMGQTAVDRLLDAGLARESEGAIIMDLEQEGLDVLVIRKSDGTGLYATSDLGLALEKAQSKWDTSIVLTDVRQGLYFKQLFKTLSLLGQTRNFKHLGYEMVRLVGATMSSRKGTVILYEDFRDEVVAHAKKETHDRHPDWSQEKIEHTAHAIGIAAIKFSMLRVKPENIITFDKEEALSFSGFSAPYILYTNARINSIIEKVEFVEPDNTYEFAAPQEKQLILQLSRFEEVIFLAAQQNDPSVLCSYAHELARDFGSFYDSCSVKGTEDATTAARLSLIKAVSQTLENCLTILGIPLLTEM